MALQYLLDKTSNANNLTNNEAVAVPDSPFSGRTSSMKLVGASVQYLTASSIAAIQLTDFTIECWVKRASTGSRVYLVSKYNPSTNNRSYEIGIDGNNTLLCNISTTGSNGSTQNSTGTISSTTTWNHLAVSYQNSSGNIVFYINGTKDSTATGLSGVFSTSNANLTIGAETGDLADPYDGKIGEVRLWNAVLSDVQVLNNYNKALVGNETNLVAYYPFILGGNGSILFNLV